MISENWKKNTPRSSLMLPPELVKWHLNSLQLNKYHALLNIWGENYSQGVKWSYIPIFWRFCYISYICLKFLYFIPIIFFVKKMVPIQLYKVCWNKCSVARFTVYIFSVTLSKDTCSNKLGLSKSPESSQDINANTSIVF
jgi:hypothetical protein